MISVGSETEGDFSYNVRLGDREMNIVFRISLTTRISALIY
jgi:hypothetical protein